MSNRLKWFILGGAALLALIALFSLSAAVVLRGRQATVFGRGVPFAERAPGSQEEDGPPFHHHDHMRPGRNFGRFGRGGPAGFPLAGGFLSALADLAIIALSVVVIWRMTNLGDWWQSRAAGGGAPPSPAGPADSPGEPGDASPPSGKSPA